MTSRRAMADSTGAKRVLFVDHVTRILGGAEINLVELAEAAAGQWKILCACRRDSRLSAALAPLPVEQADYGLPESLNTLRVVGKKAGKLQFLRGLSALREARQALAAIIRETKPDAIISCTNKDHFVAAQAAASFGIPSLWWVNDILSKEFFPWAARFLFHRNARRASRLIPVSGFSRQVLLAAGQPPGKVLTIRNGIPLDRYRRSARGAIRRSLGLSDDAIVAGLVGRYTRWKGQLFFAQLAEQLLARGNSAHFVMIGAAFNEDQGYEQELRSFVESKNLGDRIHFIPFQKDTAAVLSDLDALVHASLQPEPFGRVIIEAQAVEVPVIAANAGGVPEIIRHGDTGLLAKPGDLTDYQKHLEALLSSGEMRDRISRGGLARVQAEFGIERVREQFDAALSEILRPA